MRDIAIDIVDTEQSLIDDSGRTHHVYHFHIYRLPDADPSYLVIGDDIGAVLRQLGETTTIRRVRGPYPRLTFPDPFCYPTHHAHLAAILGRAL